MEQRRHWIWDIGLIAVLVALVFTATRLLMDPDPKVSVSSAAAESTAPYTFLVTADGIPAAWDCATPIEIATNFSAVDQAERPAVRADFAAAIAAIEEVSLFRFSVIGDTTVVPTKRWGLEWVDQTPRAPVVFAVAPYAATDLDRPDTAATAGNFWTRTDTGAVKAFAGYVIVDAARIGDYVPGSGHRSRQALFTHELLHVLNLDHVVHADSVLTARVSDSHGSIGLGDIAGLAELARIGCGR